MTALIARAWNAWDRFWFGFDHPLGLALTRIQLGLVLVWIYSARQLGSLQWLGATPGGGMVPRERALEVMPDFFRPPFGWFFWPDSLATTLHALFVLLCVLILLGIGTRWIAWFAWILHMGFIQRNYSILFGADVISCLFLLYLAFTRCDDRLSLLSLWRSRPARGPSLISSLFARLMQIQLGVIYLYTGFEKLKGASWWDGTALWTVLGNPQMVKHDLGWVRHFPLVIAAVTFLTVIFEVYWPAAMLSERLRRLWLGAGVLFHAGIGALMGLWTFSLTMLAPYWLFLTPAECDRIFVSVRGALARFFPLSRRIR